MTEREKMLSQLLYDANDPELVAERTACKGKCQTYNNIPISDIDGRHAAIREILCQTGDSVHIEPDFWCDYGSLITVGENFYANHGLIILDAGGVEFGDNVLIGPSCGFHTSGHPLDAEQRNAGLEYAYPIKVGSSVWFGAGVQVLPGVTIGDNVVVGAGSIVNKDVPSDCVVAGNPWKIIRKL